MCLWGGGGPAAPEDEVDSAMERTRCPPAAVAARRVAELGGEKGCGRRSRAAPARDRRRRRGAGAGEMMAAENI